MYIDKTTRVFSTTILTKLSMNSRKLKKKKFTLCNCECVLFVNGRKFENVGKHRDEYIRQINFSKNQSF